MMVVNSMTHGREKRELERLRAWLAVPHIYTRIKYECDFLLTHHLAGVVRPASGQPDWTPHTRTWCYEWSVAGQDMRITCKRMLRLFLSGLEGGTHAISYLREKREIDGLKEGLRYNKLTTWAWASFTSQYGIFIGKFNDKPFNWSFQLKFWLSLQESRFIIWRNQILTLEIFS